MGRLFWKFFVFLWLAQFVTSLGVGIAIWSRRHDLAPPLPPPPPPTFAGTAPMPGRFGPPPDGPPPPGPPPRPPGFLPPVMPLIAGSIVSVVFAALLAGYFARPIRNLRRAFEAVADGQLATRAAPAMGRRQDELADLGADFDRMVERLEALLGAQRRLLHDVSHELRSPLARLQAAVGLLRQQPERAAEMLLRIERDTVRIDRLVGELLTLARLESGMAPAVPLAVDLAEVLDAVVDDVRFEATEKDCALLVDRQQPLPMSGDGELLRRAVENVLRNALRHSPSGSAIELTAAAGDGGIEVRIADRGPGIADGELGRIFEPFARGDGGGNGGANNGGAGDASGYGLGLSIARAVVALHGGAITAENRNGGGLQVTIRLPAA